MEAAKKIHQLKLVNGEEIIITFQDETDDNLIVSGVLALRPVDEFDEEGHEAMYGLYALFPWLTYQTDLTQICLINKSTIISMAVPGLQVQEYYTNTLRLLQEVVDKALTMVAENNRLALKDSASKGNVLRFPSSNTTH